MERPTKDGFLILASDETVKDSHGREHKLGYEYRVNRHNIDFFAGATYRGCGVDNYLVATQEHFADPFDVEDIVDLGRTPEDVVCDQNRFFLHGAPRVMSFIINQPMFGNTRMQMDLGGPLAQLQLDFRALCERASRSSCEQTSGRIWYEDGDVETKGGLWRILLEGVPAGQTVLRMRNAIDVDRNDGISFDIVGGLHFVNITSENGRVDHLYMGYKKSKSHFSRIDFYDVEIEVGWKVTVEEIKLYAHTFDDRVSGSFEMRSGTMGFGWTGSLGADHFGVRIDIPPLGVCAAVGAAEGVGAYYVTKSPGAALKAGASGFTGCMTVISLLKTDFYGSLCGPEINFYVTVNGWGEGLLEIPLPITALYWLLLPTNPFEASKLIWDEYLGCHI